LNDADVTPEPGRIWSLLAELTHHDLNVPDHPADR
jgi:hypothetical protein